MLATYCWHGLAPPSLKLRYCSLAPPILCQAVLVLWRLSILDFTIPEATPWIGVGHFTNPWTSFVPKWNVSAESRLVPVAIVVSLADIDKIQLGLLEGRNMFGVLDHLCFLNLENVCRLWFGCLVELLFDWSWAVVALFPLFELCSALCVRTLKIPVLKDFEDALKVNFNPLCFAHTFQLI